MHYVRDLLWISCFKIPNRMRMLWDRASTENERRRNTEVLLGIRKRQCNTYLQLIMEWSSPAKWSEIGLVRSVSPSIDFDTFIHGFCFGRMAEMCAYVLADKMIQQF